MIRPALTRAGLFADFSTEELGQLAASLRRRRYAQGQVIFVQGDPGSSLYLVEEGSVKISRTSSEGKEVVLAMLGPGEVFGELALLDGEPRSADAVAQGSCQLALLPREDFLRFLESKPRTALRLLAAVSRRLRDADQMVQDALCLDVPARLARVLLDLAGAQDQAHEAGMPISLRVTQLELAGMVGATRESINKWLGFFDRQGAIRRRRGSITIVQPEKLRQRFP